MGRLNRPRRERWATHFGSMMPSSGQKGKSWFQWFWISTIYKNRNPSIKLNLLRLFKHFSIWYRYLLVCLLWYTNKPQLRLYIRTDACEPVIWWRSLINSSNTIRRYRVRFPPWLIFLNFWQFFVIERVCCAVFLEIIFDFLNHQNHGFVCINSC